MTRVVRLAALMIARPSAVAIVITSRFAAWLLACGQRQRLVDAGGGNAPSMDRNGDGFERFATRTAKASGHAAAFVAATAVTVAWAASGPLFQFSDTWQLVINTGTTVLTFLMVFVIQNSLNRDSAALHVKLDELIRVTTEARDAFVGAEHMSEQELDWVREEIESHASSNEDDPPGRPR